MIFICLNILTINLLVLTINSESPFAPNEEQIKANWNIFKSNHGFHKLSSNEDSIRFKLFRENYIKVLEHNQDADENKIGYRTSINRFSAFSNEEYRKKLGLKSFKKSNLSSDLSKEGILNHAKVNQIPDSVSYYSKLNPVKNQYSCGGCWSFSAVGVIEALYSIKYNKTRRFSEQQLIDCTYENIYENYGCNGGYPSNAFQYIKDLGLVEDVYYPYRAARTKCFENHNNFKPRTKISGYGEVPYGNENYLKRIVGTVGPVAVGVDASLWGFAHYSSGIYSDHSCSQTKINHAVMVVGYGSENGKDYWLIRNSWGPGWGIGGYMKLARNKNNMCGVASMASYAYL